MTGRAENAIRSFGLRSRLFLGAGIALVILVLLMAAFQLKSPSDPGEPIAFYDTPVDDLLSWIPANEVTSRAFAVWTPDPSGEASSPDVQLVYLPEALSLEPAPQTLGHTHSWLSTFGWNADLVGSWATAGPNAEIAVLAGDFDMSSIASHLKSVGYRESRHRGYRVFTIDPAALDTTIRDGDSPAAASTVAIVDRRLITSVSHDLVTQAIDAAVTGRGSLGNDPRINAALKTLAPLNALSSVSLADHAAACLPGATALPADNAGAVIVGYGRLGVGGVRRTLVATMLPSAELADHYSASYENGWFTGVANAGGAGGSISAFGTLTTVTRSDSLLVAELVDGRDGGWVRSGIRFALPVCDLSLAISPAATPVAGAELESLDIPDRLDQLLPIIGDDDGIRRSITFDAEPLSIATPEATALEIFSLDPASIQAWESTFELDFSTIRGIGEVRESPERPPVGVLIGTWDRDRLTAHLVSLGYDWIDFGEVRHFAYTGTNLSTSPAGEAWKNIAIYGDQMWFSADQQLMRDVIDAALAQ